MVEGATQPSREGAAVDLPTLIKSAHLRLEEEAARVDRDGGFPEAGLNLLRGVGALVAPLPVDLGGSGLGTMPHAATGLLSVLRVIGNANLSLARLFEGHVNALKLIIVYGSPRQAAAAAADAVAGHLFGIWVTEADAPVTLAQDGDALRLAGRKVFASGALHVTRPLITARQSDGAPRMVLVRLDGPRVATPTIGGLSGMRGTATGSCDFNGILVMPDDLIGGADDYLRQPEFSAGAWRGMAAALGGIDRLVELLCAQLQARGRADVSHQRERIGRARIAQETAALWTRKAALIAEGGRFADADIAATVDLARIACERAGLEVIELVQRGLGLSGFLQTNPAERIMRDVATFLRQPAPDETLVSGAGQFIDHPLPDAEAAP